MRTAVSIRSASATAVAVCTASLSWSAVPAPTDVSARAASPARTREGLREWHFTVLLDGKPIGRHDFVVRGDPDDAQVLTHARFKVTLLLVPLYHYEHEDHESWRGGCLAQMDAHTRDNGRESEVHGHSTGDAFEVRGPQGATSLPGCVMSFAYWDLRLLASHRLLNAQTGEYQPVVVTDRGRERVDVRNVPVVAEHYSLAARQFRIDLWYSLAGEWLALESRADQGRTLRYELR